MTVDVAAAALADLLDTSRRKRVTHEDIDAFLSRGRQVAKGGAVAGLAPNTEVEDVKIVGLRRRIADSTCLDADFPYFAIDAPPLRL